MRLFVKLFLVAAMIDLVGCAAPKPPGWPDGEERPINASQTTKVLK